MLSRITRATAWFCICSRIARYHDLGKRKTSKANKVLAVTVLTGLEIRDLEELGIAGTPVEAVMRLACLAQCAGLGGVVASPREISALR
jgi:orotidine-5'-phosphate decarboxylase